MALPWFQKWTKSIPNNWKRVPNSNSNFYENFYFQVKIAEIWPSPGRKNERKTSQKDQKGFSIQILTFLKIFIFRSKLPKFGPMFIQWCQIRHIGSISATSIESACFESILIWRWIKTLHNMQMSSIQRKCIGNCLNLALSPKIWGFRKIPKKLLKFMS